MLFLRFFRRRPKVALLTHYGPRLPSGERVYAIGDIHGRLDLLDLLLAKIKADNRTRGPAETNLVFLGDLVDRGPDSRGVIDRLISLSPKNIIYLMGNHEELLLRLSAGDTSLGRTFHRVGGRETLLSYGVTSAVYDDASPEDLSALAATHVPQEHISFLKKMRNSWRHGDYIFVHAGIRPGIALEDQDPVDLRWIRGEFTNSEEDHGAVVIHGHTVTPSVDIKANRIGIDTGAYATGRLTAIGLEGTARWFLQS